MEETDVMEDTVRQASFDDGPEEQEVIQAEWVRSVELVTIYLANDLSVDETSSSSSGANATTKSALDVHQELHRVIDKMLKRRMLERFLGSENQSVAAPLILGFLVEQDIHSGEGSFREAIAQDLATLLHVDSWRDVFVSSALPNRVSDHCRYVLASKFPDMVRAHARREHVDGFTFLDIDAQHPIEARTKLKELLSRQCQNLVSRGARIVILGDRGSGKSSCVNAAFGEVFAAAGAGRSVTQSISMYEATETCPVHIYDTKGFETLRDNSDAVDQLKQLIEERAAAFASYELGDPEAVKEQLHMVWWVIDVLAGGRFDPESMKELSGMFGEAHVPVIIVLNKCDAPADIVEHVSSQVREHCFWAANVVCVAADPKQGPLMLLCEHCGSDDISIRINKKQYTCESCGKRSRFQGTYGMDELIKTTVAKLPDAVASSFLRAQRLWLEGLDKSAFKLICTYGAIAFGIGAAPIPAYSRFVLWPLQVTMVLALAHLYGVIMTKRTVVHFLMSVGGVWGFGLLGWTLASICKVIPFLNVIGMATDACVSCCLTVTMGFLTRTLLRRVRGKAVLDNKEITPDDIAELMSEEERRNLFQQYYERVRAPLAELLTDMGQCIGAASLEERLSSAAFNDPIESEVHSTSQHLS
eukprot:TRINITY_DN65162_c0_g1_i1.p1 TRINITY_DN65162_c0_g1~~TRINITY_DN65162_c0_g1_i1.p1  ORF type:complete len:644 (-),score=111.88 TRINITY_DN65162_c0_g1_i1:333-2264(-)